MGNENQAPQEQTTPTNARTAVNHTHRHTFTHTAPLAVSSSLVGKSHHFSSFSLLSPKQHT